VFFTGIALMALFFLSASITAWAGWYTVFKRVWEAMSQFLIVGFGLMLILGLGVYFGWHHLYHWADPTLLDPESTNFDKISVGKSGFLNANMYVIFGGIIVLGWYFFANRMRAISLDEDNNGGDAKFSHHRRLRTYAAIFLPIAGFTSAAMVWLWIMSVDSHWYSTLFAWYAGASWFVSMMAVTIMVISYMKGKGYFENVTSEHLHDLGKLLFAFSIFWTYLWFSQYMLIWYGNVGEETIYFKQRIDNYPVLFYGNVLINFVLPFFILMRNDNKRKYGTLLFTAGAVFIGHWWDFFLMLKPGILHTAHEVAGHGHGGDSGGGHGEAGGHVSEFLMGFNLPGFLEIGTFIGFLSLFLFFFWRTLSSSQLTPSKDPFLEESLHHHV
jgi:Ni/Fe-hydrogenase subunit HybB-like protein